MLKSPLTIVLLLGLSGCASINVPNYIKDEYPYKRLIYAPFEEVRAATEQTLKEYSWTIARESDPALFEVQRKTSNGAEPQILMFTEIRQTSFFVGSKYSRLNAYLRSLPDGATEIEMRYAGIANIMFKQFNDYRNDRAVERILNAIEEKVK